MQQTAFNVRTDFYSVEFKLKHKDGSFLPVKRKSIIFQIFPKSILSRLDEWEILSRHNADYVYPEISVSNYSKTNELNEHLYRKNLDLLGISDFFTLDNGPYSDKLIKVFHSK